jgi:hypothetical protein
VRAGVARTATLPDIVLRVAPGIQGTSASNAAAATTDAVSNDATGAKESLFARWLANPWVLAAVAFAFLWLATLWWGLHRKATPAAAQPIASSKPETKSGPKPALAQALAKGDPEAISQALCAAANADDLDGVHARLDDASQRAAVEALQRARWGDGDIASALGTLREAFKRGPRWKAAGGKAKGLLPPLYPQ